MAGPKYGGHHHQIVILFTVATGTVLGVGLTWFSELLTHIITLLSAVL